MADAQIVADVVLDSKQAIVGARATAASVRSIGPAATVATTGVGRLKAAFIALSKTGVIVAITAVVAVLSKLGTAIKSAGVQELAERKLGNALRNLGEDAASGVGGLKELAGQLQNVTGIGDEVQLTGLSILATYKSVAGVEGLKLLAPRLLDIAAANKEAGAEITTLKGEAQALGKALDGQASLLRRYGVSLTDAEVAALNAAEGLEKVKILTEVLDTNFAGAAEAAADPFKVLQAAVGDLWEEVGGTDGTGLRGALSGAAIRLTHLAQQEGVRAAFRATGQVIGALIKVLLALVDGTRIAWAALVAGSATAVTALVFNLGRGMRALESFAATAAIGLSQIPHVGAALQDAFGSIARVTDGAADNVERWGDGLMSYTAAAQQSVGATISQVRASRAAGAEAARLTSLLSDAEKQTRGVAGAMAGAAGADGPSLAAALTEAGGAMQEAEQRAAKLQAQLADLNSLGIAEGTERAEAYVAKLREIASLQASIAALDIAIAQSVRNYAALDLNVTGDLTPAAIDSKPFEVDLGDLTNIAMPVEDVARAFRDGLLVSILDTNAALDTLYLAFDKATTPKQREQLQGMIDGVEGLREKMVQATVATVDLGNVSREMLQDLATGIGEAVGQFAAGVSQYGTLTEAIGASVLTTLADIAIQTGRVAVATGIAVLGIKKALQTLNPFAAIAAGVALIALGSYVKGRLGGIAAGGGSAASGARGSAATSASQAGPATFYVGQQANRPRYPSASGTGATATGSGAPEAATIVVENNFHGGADLAVDRIETVQTRRQRTRATGRGRL